MTLSAQIEGVTVAKEASVYFSGKCISHALTLPDGGRKSVGVILPATLTFNTAGPEVMEIVAGSCSVRMGGEAEWRCFATGQSFEVGANSSFDIQVVGVPLHYVCHYG
ncbi:MAG: pyrimidine/purine nucleoside phosphorylase [Rhodocyclaceae bacterium]|nr:pyrimidine/purine nucleoside phosphorylase [Rhodocyclaceae bacterium]MCB1959423.1 pyrimidine/purine nucleoside phosphorylase [Rhodocyclaceae bacterium]MCB1962695.1 pyrimidine/purine nucleoside phosphorylase [Rhodocyclaceae bacterium]